MTGPRTIELALRKNRSLAPHTFVLEFAGSPALAQSLPGQFVMLRSVQWGTDPLLARAFSLLRVDAETTEILVKTAGKATARLEHARVGEVFSIVGPLGNRFPEPAAHRSDFYVAGGVGLAPLLMQARAAQVAGVAERATMFYGGRTADDLVLLDDIRATGVELVLATEDGSVGHRGYVTAAVQSALATSPNKPTILACGPEPMLQAVAGLAHASSVDTYVSLEGEMACGIGACLVCAVPCKGKSYRYACVNGPVFALAELAGAYAAAESTEPTA